MTVVERKYALTKLAPGDYVLPSNDGQMLWRIARYEDGIAQGLDHDLGVVWALWKYRHRVREGAAFDPDDWDAWQMWEGAFPTRTAAVDAALSGESS